ncbi:MAG: hypothetical protein QXW41_09270 [Fervidicoccaceae archaeon]
MLASAVSVCSYITRIPEEARRNVYFYAGLLRIERLLSSGGVENVAAAYVLAERFSKVDPRFGDVYKRVGGFYKLYSYVYNAYDYISKLVERASNDDSSGFDFYSSSLSSVYNGLAQVINDPDVSSVVSSETLGSARRFLNDLSVFVNGVLPAFKNASDRVSKLYGEVRSAVDALSAQGNLDDVVNRLLSVFLRVNDELSPVVSVIRGYAGSVSDDGVKKAVNALADVLGSRVNALADVSWGLYEVYSNFSSLSSALSNAIDLVSKAGSASGYTLSDDGYRGRIVGYLTSVLASARRLSEIADILASKGFDSSFTQSLKDVSTSYIAFIRQMRDQLASSDIRWADVFREAAANANVDIGEFNASQFVDYIKSNVDKLVDASPLPDDAKQSLKNLLNSGAVAQFVSAYLDLAKRIIDFDMYITSVLRSTQEKAWRDMFDGSKEIWRRALATVARVGLGFIDAASLIIRPKSLAEVLKSLADGVANIGGAIASGDWKRLQGMVDDFVRSVCGSPERCALFIADLVGQALFFVAGPKIISSMPMPARLRVALNTLLTQDPSYVIKYLRFEKVLGEVRVSTARALDAASASVSNADVFLSGLRRYIQRFVEAGVVGKRISSVLDSIEKSLYQRLKAYNRVGDAFDTIKRSLDEVGVEKILSLFENASATARDIAKDLVSSVEKTGSEMVSTLLRPVRERLVAPNIVVTRLRPAELHVATPKPAAAPSVVAPSVPRVSVSLTTFVKIQELADILRRIGSLAGVPQKVEGLVSRFEASASQLLEKLSSYERLRGIYSRFASGSFAAQKSSFEGVRSAVASELRSAGFSDLARAVEAARDFQELSRVLGSAVEEMSRTVSSEASRLSNTLENALKRFSSIPEVRELYNRVSSMVERRVEVSPAASGSPVSQAVAGVLPIDVQRRVASVLGSSDLPLASVPGVGDAVRRVVELARAGRLGLSDLASLGDIIAKYSPEAASAVEREAFLRVARAVESLLTDLSRSIPELSQYVERIGSFIQRIESYVPGVGGVSIEAKVSLPAELRENVDVISSMLRELDPDLASRFSDAFSKLSDKIASGRLTADDVASVVRVLDDVRRFLKDIGYIPGGLVDRLSALLSRLSPEVRELKPVVDFAPQILRDLQSLPRLPEGWRFLEIRGRVVKGLPVAIPADVASRVEELLNRPSVVYSVDVEGVGSVRVSREFSIDPNQRMVTLRYVAELPNGRRIYISSYKRAVGGQPPMVRVESASVIDYDPPLKDAIRAYMSGDTSNPLYREGESVAKVVPRLVDSVVSRDPMADVIDRIVVLGSSSPGLVSLARAALASAAASLAMASSVLSVGASQPSPQHAMLLQSLAVPKDQVLEALKPGVAEVPGDLSSEVINRGYIPVAVVNPAQYIANTVIPMLSQSQASEVLGALSRVGVSPPPVPSPIDALRQVVSQLKEVQLIDLLNIIRKVSPNVEQILKSVEQMIDKIIVVGVPTSQAFLPSLENWGEVVVGRLRVPVPIIGRFRGKNVVVVPLATSNIAAEALDRIAQVATPVMGMSMFQIQLLTPQQVQQAAQPEQAQVSGAAPQQPRLIMVESVSPLFGFNLQPSASQALSAISRGGRQVERLAI